MMLTSGLAAAHVPSPSYRLAGTVDREKPGGKGPHEDL